MVFYGVYIHTIAHSRTKIFQCVRKLVINLVGAYVSSAKYTRRGVKVVYLGFVGTGGSL